MTSAFHRVFLLLATILLAIDGKAYAKRGCSAFGHSCFGGHGKRFVPRTSLANGLQETHVISLYSSDRDNESPLSSNELSLAEENFKMENRQERSNGNPRNAQLVDPFTLSFLVDQWLASHRPVHQQDFAANND